MVNCGYLASHDGLIKFTRFLFELIAWTCIVDVSGYSNFSNAQYAAAILIISWILDFIWIVLHIFDKQNSINMDLNRFNLWTAVLMSFLVFIGFITITVEATVPLWKNAAAFAFFTFCNWIYDLWVCRGKQS